MTPEDQVTISKAAEGYFQGVQAGSTEGLMQRDTATLLPAGTALDGAGEHLWQARLTWTPEVTSFPNTQGQLSLPIINLVLHYLSSYPKLSCSSWRTGTLWFELCPP